MGNSELTEIISYMNLCKGEADEKDTNRKRKASGDPDRIRGGKNQKTNKKFKNECKLHGGHEWKDCSRNPQSENFGKYVGRGRNSNQNYGGRGNYGGRFGNRYQGRGNQNGGRGRGNYSNNYRNQYNNNNDSNQQNQNNRRENYYQQSSSQSRDQDSWTQPDHYHIDTPDGGWRNGNNNNNTNRNDNSTINTNENSNHRKW